jgi:hypothetical protein
MTTISARPKSKKGPKEVAKTLRSAASALEHGRHATAKKKLAEIKPRTFTAQETDTIIAALRLWQRCPMYPEIEIAEEHGDMLSDSSIDDLIEEINFGDVSAPPRPEPAINRLRQSDKELAILDAAVNVAEDILKSLLCSHNATQVKDAFLQHVRTHLGEELMNIAAHGHRNDVSEDEPTPSIYDEMTGLAELVAAGNTDYDGLERRANEILARIGR